MRCEYLTHNPDGCSANNSEQPSSFARRVSEFLFRKAYWTQNLESRPSGAVRTVSLNACRRLLSSLRLGFASVKAVLIFLKPAYS
jgi:hypothetical protein